MKGITQYLYQLRIEWHCVLENFEHEVFRSGFNKLGCMKLCLIENEECPAKRSERYIVCNAELELVLVSHAANMHQLPPLVATGFPALPR